MTHMGPRHPSLPSAEAGRAAAGTPGTMVHGLPRSCGVGAHGAFNLLSGLCTTYSWHDSSTYHEPKCKNRFSDALGAYRRDQPRCQEGHFPVVQATAYLTLQPNVQGEQASEPSPRRCAMDTAVLQL